MSASNAVPIAIVGIGCRFPGGVETPGDLWQLAADGRSTVGPVPADRWEAASLAAVHDPDLAGRARRGCFLDADVWAWDPAAFSVAPLEQRWVDPQFRVLMEVAWQAVEHAGIPIDRMRGSPTGVYIGTYAPDSLLREARPVEDAPNSAYLFGNFTAGAAGRIAFSMDLRGPVMVVSTHCSSGLVALDTACAALTLGECDIALAGAVLLMLSPQTHYCEAPLLLSGRGACYAFDSRADGYVRGEGAGVLVLKRLADARRHGDRVLAVIRGSAVNNDGQASRLTAPSGEMQQRLFRVAVDRAGIDPGEVGLVEAHGPGTAVGDPVEYASINAVYGQGSGRCALGSVKTNIGHSEPVSGIAGMVKAVESLRRGLIPPNATFRQWSPSIPVDAGSRLFVPTSLTGWPVVAGGQRWAAVCSYGVTGTNAHVVLEAAPTSAPRRSTPRKPPAGQEHRLYLLSANSAQALARMASRLKSWLEGHAGETPLLDVAHTLAQRRSHADHRLGVVAGDGQQLAARAAAFTAGQTSDGMVSGTPVLPPSHAGPVFVFTGQGSQRPGMCQGLLACEPVFAAVVDQVEPLIRIEAGFSLREVLLHPQRLVGVQRIQPALFGVQVALAELWRSWGIEPSAVIGQSLGEVAAMVVAGGLSLADGVKVICRRSALLATISGGSMASVLLPADQVRAAIDAEEADRVTLGVLTSPGSTVVSGDTAQVSTLVRRWEMEGVVAKLIDVEVASHSSQVDPVLGRLHDALSDVAQARPKITHFSTVSADPRDPGIVDGAYWVRNQRETVRFHAAVGAALDAGHRVFVECSPHPLAVRPTLEIAQGRGIHDVVAVGSLRQGTDDSDAFLANVGALHVSGFDGIDFAARYGKGQLADVPVTDWHRTRHGGDDPVYRLVAPALPGATQHALLGGHVQDPDDPQRHLWQSAIGARLVPWLEDHKVAGVPVLPGTGLAEMMLAAAVSVYGTDGVAAANVSVLSPLLLDSEPQVTTRLVREADAAVVEIVSTGPDAVTVHARGTVRTLTEHERRPISLTGGDTAAEGWHDVEVETLHRTFRDKHDVFHGPAFIGIDRIRVHPQMDVALARLRIHDTARVSAWPMILHPALADQVVQVAVATWLAHYTLTPGPVVVAGFDEIRVYGSTAHTRTAVIRLHKADDLGCTASARLATAEGAVVAEIRGLRVANITPPAERFNARLTHLEWVPAAQAPHRARNAEGTWAVLTTHDNGNNDNTWPAELVLDLKSQTAGCRQIPLTEFLTDPDVLSPCTGVVLAVPDDDSAAVPSDTAQTVVGSAITLIRQLCRREGPPRLWAVSRAGRSPLSTASLRGLFRAAAYEHPELRAGSLEFAQAVDTASAVTELLDDGQPLTEILLVPQRRLIARVLPGAGATAAAGNAQAPIRPGAAYVVSGGLGGLGLLTVEWLARCRAGRIVIVGRSAPEPPIEQRLDALRSTGTDVVVIGGDVGDPAVAARAVATARQDGCSLRGVFHCAGVVEDATIATLDERLLERVWQGKATGAWALHHATRHTALDLFVVYSSVASLIGSPGQAAYCAANAFADGLVQRRLAQGLAATGIHWGAWGEVGRGQHLADQGYLTISPTDGIEALQRILTTGHTQIAYSTLDLDRWTAPYPAVRSSRLLSELITDHGSAQDRTDIIDQLLSSDTLPGRRAILESFIIESIRALLGGTSRHIGAHTSMVILGIDSLGAVQLQQRLNRALRTEMKPGVIWVKPTAAALAEWLLEHTGLDQLDWPDRPPGDVG